MLKTLLNKATVSDYRLESANEKVKSYLRNLVYAHLAGDKKATDKWHSKIMKTVLAFAPNTERVRRTITSKVFKSVAFSKAAYAVGMRVLWDGRLYEKGADKVWRAVPKGKHSKSDTLKNPLTDHPCTLEELINVQAELSNKVNTHWEKMGDLSQRGYEKEADLEHKQVMATHNQLWRVTETIKTHERAQKKADRRAKLLTEAENIANDPSKVVSITLSRLDSLKSDVCALIDKFKDREYKFDEIDAMASTTVQWVASRLENGKMPVLPVPLKVKRHAEQICEKIHAIKMHLPSNKRESYLKDVATGLRKIASVNSNT